MNSKKRSYSFLFYTLGLLLFFAFWWGVSALVGQGYLPSPLVVLREIITVDFFLVYGQNFGLTLVRGLAAFSSAWVLSLGIGLLMGKYQGAREMGFFPLFLLQGAPPLLWITPLFVALHKTGLMPVAVSFLVVLPLLTAHISAARSSIKPWEQDVFKIYNSKGSVVARELYLPKFLPAIKANIQLGFLIALKAVLLGEWFGAKNGIGHWINYFHVSFDLSQFLAWALVFLLSLGLLSLVLSTLLRVLLPSYHPSPWSYGVPGEDLMGKKTHQQEPKVLPPFIIKDLAFGYGHKPLFSGVHLELTQERPTVIYGPSGCGKTSFLKVLSNLAKTWKGEVEGPKKRVLLFQDDLLLDHRDALGNVLLPALPHPQEQDVDRAQEALKLWGLGGKEKLFPHQLSGGMKKRLAMARAWFFQPEVLLLDEPFVNLDFQSRKELWESLFSLPKDFILLIVTHYPDELSLYQTNVYPWEKLFSPEI